MSITDELREWAEGDTLRAGMSLRTAREQALAIADRIDAEELSRRNGAYNMGYNAGIDMGFASADDWLADHEDAMAEHGWVKLPVDADGEVIHIGDVMEGVDKYDSLEKVMGEVTTISFDATFDPDDSRSVGIRVWSDDRRSYHTAYLDPRASVYRHHREPTVEDVLKDFIDAWAEWKDGAAMMNPVETYASKLRLVGDAE